MLSFTIPELWHTPSTCSGIDRHHMGDSASQSPGKRAATRTAGCSTEVKSYKSKDSSKRPPLVIQGKNNIKTASPEPLQEERPHRY